MRAPGVPTALVPGTWGPCSGVGGPPAGLAGCWGCPGAASGEGRLEPAAFWALSCLEEGRVGCVLGKPVQEGCLEGLEFVPVKTWA